MTSLGLNNQIGNHVIVFINYPDQRLPTIFSSVLATELGITRLEETIYNYKFEHTFDSIEDCLNVLENNKIICKIPLSILYQFLLCGLK